MAARTWLSTVQSWLLTLYYHLARNITASRVPLLDTTSEISLELSLERKNTRIFTIDGHVHHDVLRQANILEWCEWHLTIGENDKAIEIAEKFHQELEKSKLSPSIAGKIDTIEETFLKYMPTDKGWNQVRTCFQRARKDNSPRPIITAYTYTQQFSKRINQDSATNTYHALKLYCTLLNCPDLAKTQEYTEAVTSLLFHREFDEFLVRNITAYRGVVLKDKSPITNYKQGATIITTTFLSTSTDREVAEAFATVPPEDKTLVSVFCTYNIKNTRRRTALNLKKTTNFNDEAEILILRYVPFTIKSIERMNDGRRVNICFDECEERYNVEEKVGCFNKCLSKFYQRRSESLNV